MSLQTKPLLTVDKLSICFQMYDTVFTRSNLRVISDLSVTVSSGEILAIAGSSGSGKSLLAHAILGILPKNASTSGKMNYKGKELTPRLLKVLRGKEIALIPQSVNYLDPLMKVKNQVLGVNKDRKSIVKMKEVFCRLGLDESVEDYYPFQLSGGMARRVLFSTAILSGAQLIIADEPTPGMHIEQAAEALYVLRELANNGKGVILITHDIDLALKVADRVAVFYAGTTVETAPVADFKDVKSLRHPYSKKLWSAMPQHGFKRFEGFCFYSKNLPAGCFYAINCPCKTRECEECMPNMREIRGGMVRCHHAT